MATATKTYEYAVRDRDGKVVKGRLAAANEAAVASRLRQMGVATISVTEVQTSGLQKEISIPGFGNRVTLKDLAVMARQLATMINSGLSLLRALAILAEQTESKALAASLTEVRNDVEAGTALSAALAKHPETFPPLMLSMIRAGETGGFLDEVLLSVASNFEAEVRLRGKVKSAMSYPVVVFAIAILAVVGMLLFIVPIFEGLFSSLGGELPAPTQFLVFLSGVLKWTIGPFVVALLVFLAWWRKHKHDPAIRERLDPLKLRAPVFGNLAKKIAISRFTRNFGTMIRSGVPLLQALEIVGATSGNFVIEKAARSVQESVRSGQSLSGPLSQHAVFPPMVVQMMAVGEDTGALDDMLAKIADFYDQEVESTTEQLTSLIEPLMIVVLGSLIGGMIIALYMPIFTIFNLVQ